MDRTERSRRASNRDQVAEFFRQRPMVWVDAQALEAVGGRQAWRTRVSECRVDLGMVIDNRVRRGEGVVISEYRYVPSVPLARDDRPPRPQNLFS